MKAVILCAGYGTRLNSISNKPKALLPVKNIPIINHIIKKIEAVDKIDEIVIVVNAKFYSSFVLWLDSGPMKFRKKISLINDGTTSNETRLGGIADLQLALDKRKIKDDILVLYGDNLFDFSLESMAGLFTLNKQIMNCVMEISDFENAKKCGVVEIEGEKLISFEEKPENPKTGFISLGVYMFPKEDIHLVKTYLKEGREKENVGFLIKHLIETGKREVYGYKCLGKFIDIGTPSAYNKANESLEKEV